MPSAAAEKVAQKAKSRSRLYLSLLQLGHICVNSTPIKIEAVSIIAGISMNEKNLPGRKSPTE